MGLIDTDDFKVALDTYDKFGYTGTNELIRLNSDTKNMYVPYIKYSDVIKCIDNTPVLEPERTKGEWESIKKIDDDAEYGEIDAAQCSICKHTEDSEYWAKTYYNFCPNCGAQMIKEVKKNDK